jgi:hypothetical protein
VIPIPNFPSWEWQVILSERCLRLRPGDRAANEGPAAQQVRGVLAA